MPHPNGGWVGLATAGCGGRTRRGGWPWRRRRGGSCGGGGRGQGGDGACETEGAVLALQHRRDGEREGRSRDGEEDGAEDEIQDFAGFGESQDTFQARYLHDGRLVVASVSKEGGLLAGNDVTACSRAHDSSLIAYGM